MEGPGCAEETEQAQGVCLITREGPAAWLNKQREAVTGCKIQLQLEHEAALVRPASLSQVAWELGFHVVGYHSGSLSARDKIEFFVTDTLALY